MMVKNPRVFLGFLDICGLYWALRSGLQEAGARVYFLDLGEDTLGYRKAQSLRFVPEFFRRSYVGFTGAKGARRFSLRYLFRAARLSVAMVLLVVWIILRFDIFVLKSGQSLAGGTLLFRLLRLFRKTIIFTYHGSDSRPPYLNGVIKLPDEDFAALVATRKRHIDRVSPFAGYIVDSPVSAHFQTGRCCVRQCIFNPMARLDISPQPGKRETTNGAVRILHAPSYPELKGSGIIRAVIEKLKKEGRDIEYIELSGVTNAEVLAAINQCDLVVDELYSDTYGAVFALEAAAQGKPSLVCGYARGELDRFVPEEARLPTHYCPPEEFETALRLLVDDSNYRLELGRKALRFTETWAAPRAAAERLLRLARGDAPDEWFFEPRDIRYAHGVGGTGAKVRQQVSRLIDSSGPAALRVDDKPELRDTLAAFAGKSV